MSDEANAVLASTGSTESPSEGSVEQTQVDTSNVDTSPQEGSQEPTEQSSQDTDFSDRFAALARQEKHNREQSDLVKNQLKDVEKYTGVKDKFKNDPIAALQELGIPLDTIVNSYLGVEAPEPTTDDNLAKLQKEFNDYKQGIEDAKSQKAEEQEKANEIAYAENIQNHQNDIKKHLEENAEQYKITNAFGEQDLVWEVTEAHFEQTGEVLSIDQASQKVETYLTSKFEDAQSKLGLSKKEEPKVEDNREFIDKIVNSHTLTQNTYNQNESSNEPNSRALTDDERLAKAADLLKWD